MAEITVQMVKEIRERTGAGMSDCKKALQETDGDMDKAIDYLRTKGLAAASKKAGKIATEGQMTSYIHLNNRIGVLVEVNCQTDFAAKTDDFKAFCKDISMQIAASSPQYVTDAEIDQGAIEKERVIRTAAAKEEGKKEEMIPRIVEGQIAKWKKEVCLLDQPYIRDTSKDIRTLMNELIAKIGENVKVRRFVRWELGEGIEKKVENFAEEVAKQLQP